MNPRLELARILAVAAVGSMGLAAAQGITNPSLVLSTTRSPATYHIGEPIELVLSFSANPGGYCYKATGWERYWPQELEVFRVVPTDNIEFSGERTSDPYFDGSAFGFLLGGSFLSNELPLSTYVRKEYLNDWLRFATPGRYLLTVTSARVSRSCELTPRTAHRSSITLQSNPVEIRILAADQEWSRGDMAEIRKILDSPSIGETAKRHTARRLGYLNTDQSAAELATRFVASEPGPYRSQLVHSLFESTFRDTAIRILDASLRDRANSVPGEIYHVLATLRASREFQSRAMPNWQADIEAYRLAGQQSEDRYNAIVLELRMVRWGTTDRP